MPTPLLTFLVVAAALVDIDGRVLTCRLAAALGWEHR